MKDYLIYVLIQPSGSNDYWIKRLIEGIKDEAQHNKKHLKAAYFSVEEETELLSFGEQPVLLVGTTTKWFSSSAAYVRSHGGYPIYVGACLPKLPYDFGGAYFAIEQAVRDCISYLEQLGKKHLVLVGLNPSSDADHKKAKVFREHADNTWISDPVFFCEHAGLEESISEYVKKVLALGADAMICSNDTTAILAISYLKKHNVAVGKEYPVLGMGNSFLGMNASPSLTSVNFDYYALGREAVRLYEYQLHSESGVISHVRIPTELIIRDSTGAIPFNNRKIAVDIGNQNLPDYFGGNLVSRLIMLENDLQHSDPIDREIIFGTARGETYTQLANRLYLSERTLKYRLSHILKRLGLHSKSELSTLVQEVFGKNDSL